MLAPAHQLIKNLKNYMTIKKTIDSPVKAKINKVKTFNDENYQNLAALSQQRPIFLASQFFFNHFFYASLSNFTEIS